jgi:hypothetical protein
MPLRSSFDIISGVWYTTSVATLRRRVARAYRGSRTQCGTEPLRSSFDIISGVWYTTSVAIVAVFRFLSRGKHKQLIRRLHRRFDIINDACYTYRVAYSVSLPRKTDVSFPSSALDTRVFPVSPRAAQALVVWSWLRAARLCWGAP